MKQKRDGLKPLNELLTADKRHSHFVFVDPKTGQVTPRTIQDHYAGIEQFNLHDGVPDDIATQYDVARNIYAYAWFEYRFFNVSEANVLTVLELALKERIGKSELQTYIKQRKAKYNQETGKKLNLREGLKTLMEYCRDNQLVCNEGFSAWHHHATEQAYYKARNEQMMWTEAEMERTGKSEITLPDIVIEPQEPDESYDHVQHLINYTNQIRNSYAHGSTSLHPNVLRSFEMVCEFINQLYPTKETGRSDPFP